ncbi:MAG: class II aldolase/adducin family protein [Pseudomonadales bacterium]
MATRSTESETEGAIRFAYALEAPVQPPLDPARWHAFNGWRTVLRRLGLLGQDAGRYGGLGFGNLSVRDAEVSAQFVITASQTSGAEVLEADDLVHVVGCNIDRFWVDAVGHQPPSSESLTHAMVYQADPHVGWVLHVHSPEIWERAEALGLIATPPDVAYGSPAMAAAVAELLRAYPERPCVFVTAGHRDGVFACGASADAAGTALLSVLARALG